MTRIKLCGLKRLCDIEAVNELKPDYVGFVFVKGRKRYIDPEAARALKEALDPEIKAVGVFIDEEPGEVARLLEEGIIDVAQLHGREDEAYIRLLKEETGKPVFKAFQIHGPEDLLQVESCGADMVLLDSGTGTGKAFDWELLKNVKRPYFLAGGLGLANVEAALNEVEPYGLDVSSGIETDGFKDRDKMTAFVGLVRSADAC